MTRSKTTISTFIFFVGLFCLPLLSFAQYSNTMYYMKGVPQSNLLNPAFQPACNFYFGLPGVSPVQFNISNSSLVIHDVFFYDKELDSSIFVFNKSANKDKFLSRLSDINSISSDVSSNLASFGFRAGAMYFNFNLAQKVFMRMNYPKDLVSLPFYFTLDNLDNPRDLNLKGIGINLTSYTELSMGVSRKFFDALTLGVRGKILMGQANFSTTQSDITIDTEFDKPWLVNSHLRADASLPFTSIPRDSTGDFDFKNIAFGNPKASDVLDAFFFHPNLGLAMDFGLVYQPVEALSISVSVLDLGSIHWKNNTYNVTQNASFQFKGSDMTNFINGTDTSALGQSILDTLKNSFAFNYLEESYRTKLPTQIFFGGSVNLTKGISFGALAHLEVFEQEVRNEVTLSSNISAGKFFAFSLSYSLIHNQYNEVGLGLGFKPGPFNTYLIFDNIPTTFAKDRQTKLPVPVYMGGFNMRIGFNLIFGCNKTKKLTKDIPLVD
jgi:hypothetical protein